MNKRYQEISYLDLTTKDKEYSFVIEVGVKSYTIKTRGNHEFKVAFTASQVNQDTGNFMTIPSGSAESEDGLTHENPITIYISCEEDEEVLEIKKWR